MGIEHLTVLFPTQVSSFDFEVETSGRTVQYKLSAQSLRLFGLHSGVNDAHRAGASRLQNKTNKHTNRQTDKQTDTDRQTDRQTYRHTFIHSDIHTFIHSYIHTFIHSYIHSYIHTDIQTYIHTFIHIHTHIHAYITHIHTSSRVCERARLRGRASRASGSRVCTGVWATSLARGICLRLRHRSVWSRTRPTCVTGLLLRPVQCRTPNGSWSRAAESRSAKAPPRLRPFGRDATAAPARSHSRHHPKKANASHRVSPPRLVSVEVQQQVLPAT